MIDPTNDADLETVELETAATEHDAATCRSCHRVDVAITSYIGGRGSSRVEVYECVCGHHTVWLEHRRMS